MLSWTEYSAHFTGCTEAKESCENCHAVYYYVAQCIGTASIIELYGGDAKKSREQAAIRAEEDFHRKLENVFENVPCPKCGWLQSHMIEDIRREKFSSKGPLWLVLAVCFGMFGFGGFVSLIINLRDPNRIQSDAVPSAIGFLACLGGLMWSLYRRRSAKRQIAKFDPNLDPATPRIQEGLRRSVLQAEYQAGKKPPKWHGSPELGVTLREGQIRIL